MVEREVLGTVATQVKTDIFIGPDDLGFYFGASTSDYRNQASMTLLQSLELATLGMRTRFGRSAACRHEDPLFGKMDSVKRVPPQPLYRHLKSTF